VYAFSVLIQRTHHAKPAPSAHQQMRWEKKRKRVQTLKRPNEEKGNQVSHNRLRAAGRPGGIPLGDLHRAVLVEVLVHVKGVPQQVRLVAPALAQALELGAVQVVSQDGLIVGVRALFDDLAGALAG
jgi:hypothetical protein